MNGKNLIVLTLALASVTYGGQLFSQENVATMRGAPAINETSAMPESKDWMGKTGRFTRNFADQPPLIPHKSQNFKINLTLNKCLTCHGLDVYEKKQAVRISETHYRDRDGKQLTDLSPSRYFCTQCHVEQRNAEPLVINEFKSAELPK